MPSVIVNMEPAVFKAKVLTTSTGPDVKVRKFQFVSDELKERARALEIRKQKAAAKRGPWKDCTARERAKGRAIADEIAGVKMLMIVEQAIALSEHRQREMLKQAVARKRERLMNRGAN